MGIGWWWRDGLIRSRTKRYLDDRYARKYWLISKGTITNGKLADLTVLSQDIFAMPMSELPKTVSVLTIVGGKIIYDAKMLK